MAAAKPRDSRYHRILAVLGAARVVMQLAAIPLAPLLYRKHVGVLVFLRPTKEVLLFAGYAIENGDVSWYVVVICAIPIYFGGVWLSYALGYEYGPKMTRKALPGLLGRLLPRKRIQKVRKAIEKNGARVVFLGRLAAMPSSLIGAAAGVARFDVKRFLTNDAAGGSLAFALMVGLGYGLDEAYENAGPWLTGFGIAAFGAGAFFVGRTITKE